MSTDDHPRPDAFEARPLSELPESNAARAHAEEKRRKISEKTRRTGIRGLGFQVGRKVDQFRMCATVQWQEDDQNGCRMRFLCAHGIEGAAPQLSRVFIGKIPAHEDADPPALADRCPGALR